MRPSRIAASYTLLACATVIPFPALGGPWHPLFDGRTLDGWTQVAGQAPFTVEDGTLVGVTVAGSPNSFLATSAEYADFILELEVRQEGGPSNSGVQFRSAVRPEAGGPRVFGYQFEIDPSPRAWTGGLYDEARQGWLYPVDLNPDARTLFRPDDWNHVRIEAIGPTLRTWLNGVPVSHVIDDQSARGFIALQVHSIASDTEAGRRIRFRHLRIQTEDLVPSPADAIPIRNRLPNQLDPSEAALGWELLWDGVTPHGWLGGQRQPFPDAAWRLAEGTLALVGSTGPGEDGANDLVSEATFAAFELQWDFKLSAGARSGVHYLADQARTSLRDGTFPLVYALTLSSSPAETEQADPRSAREQVASLAGILPRRDLPRSLGIAPRPDAWQHGRVVVRPDRTVEHWLNGLKVLEYIPGSPEFLENVATSGPRRAVHPSPYHEGAIRLQHGSGEVQFRSLKIRRLD